jgi:hypothetical protein
MRYLTPNEILRFECPRCGAAVGERCIDVRFARLTNAKYNPIPKLKSFHAERKDRVINDERTQTHNATK